MISQKPLLVLVIPCFNEAGLLSEALPRILDFARAAALARQMDVRLVAVNDGSRDQTEALLDVLRLRLPELCVLNLTRNFGKEAALTAGLEQALCWPALKLVVTMDADLQHPPELLEKLLSVHEQGFAVVEAVKQHRGEESHSRRFLARPFYRLFEHWSGLPLQGQTDFKLLDVVVVRQLLQMRERGRFYRGLIAWLGFPSAQIPFDVPDRAGGQSQWSGMSLWRYAWGNLLSFSTMPLQLVTWLGALGLLVGLFGGGKALWDLLTGQALSGFTTVILLQIIFGSLTLVVLGLLGQYLGRVYEELKARPLYVLKPVSMVNSNESADKN